MKGCLIAFIVVLVIVLILVGAFAIYIFAFDKELPRQAVDAIKNALDGLSEQTVPVNFEIVNDFSNVEVTQDREVTIGDVIAKSSYYINRVGKDEEFVMEYKEIQAGVETVHVKFYKKDGKYIGYDYSNEEEMTKDDWESAVVTAFFTSGPFVLTGDGNAKFEGGDIIENNLTSVRQKGLMVTSYAATDTISCALTINLKDLKITSYEIVDKSIVGTQTKKVYALDLDMSALSA